MKTLTVEHLSHDLRGIAHAEGVVWLIEGALPDEQVVVRERARYSNRVEADVVEIIRSSALRIQPSCEYARVCGGCDVQHLDYDTQIMCKQAALREQLARIDNIAAVQWLPTLVAEPWGYRRRTRIACRWLADKKHLAVGFRQRHSQAIVEINHCAVLVPVLQKLLHGLRQCLSRWSQPRQLGHIELLAADNGDGMLLRVTSAIADADSVLLQTFATEHALTVYVQHTEDKQSIQYFCGVERTLLLNHERTESASTCIPGDFLQANAAVNTLLINAVLSALHPESSDRVLEAFCGLGNFTFSLSKRVANILALEVSGGMMQRAEKQAAMQGVTNVAWAVWDLSIKKNCERIQVDANKVLLDPPREGAQTFCQFANLKGVERIVYVSCNPSTFARDAAILAQRGFMLHQAAMVDMFPQTSHIELLAVFDAKLNASHKKTGTDQVAKKKMFKKLKR